MKKLSKGFAAPLVLLIVGLIIGAGAFFAYFQFKSFEPMDKRDSVGQGYLSSPAPQKSTATGCKKASENSLSKVCSGQIRSWVDKNKVYKFSFEVPNNYEYDTHKESNEYDFDAFFPTVNIHVGQMEGPGIMSSLHGRFSRHETNLCPNKLVMNDIGEGSLEACDIIKIDGKDALFLIDIHFRGGDGGQCERDSSLRVLQNIDDTASLLFTAKLDVLKNISKPWEKYNLDDVGGANGCPFNDGYNQIKRDLSSQIANIRNAKNLSVEDAKTMDELYQIVDSFSFVK